MVTPNTFSTNTSKRLALPATCYSSLGLAGDAWYLRQRRQLGPELLAVKAASDQPCGDKNMADTNQSKEKPKPKVSSPCKKRNKHLDHSPTWFPGWRSQQDWRGLQCIFSVTLTTLSPAKTFCYRSRKGKRGEMPSSNGDIFVHDKADSMGQLFDFCKTYLHNFPDDSVSEFEDISVSFWVRRSRVAQTFHREGEWARTGVFVNIKVQFGVRLVGKRPLYSCCASSYNPIESHPLPNSHTVKSVTETLTQHLTFVHFFERLLPQKSLTISKNWDYDKMGCIISALPVLYIPFCYQQQRSDGSPTTPVSWYGKHSS